MQKLLCVLMVGMMFGETLLVPSEYSSIQLAIDNHLQGDTILVAPGTYNESININTNYLSLISESGADNTFLTTNSGHCLEIDDSNIFLKGFTLEYTNETESRLMARESIIILEDINFNDDNVSSNNIYRGRLVNAEHSDIKFKNIIIKDSEFIFDSPNTNRQVEGGLFLFNSSKVIFDGLYIQNNFFEYNMRQTAGGLIYSTNGGEDLIINNLVITNNNFTYTAENTSYFNVIGGMIYFSNNYESVIITNSTIVNNIQNFDFNGVSLSESNINLEGTFIRMADDPGLFLNFTNSIFENKINVINGNSYNIGENNVLGFYSTDSRTDLHFSHNMIKGGMTQIVFDFVGFNLNYDNTNLDYDPQFTDYSNHDYNLQLTSPCIDAGSPDSPLDPDGTVSDIGAFYYHQNNVTPGCTDESACNYNESATHSDGSCNYTSCIGCTDPTAQNYDADNTEDDGSCLFGPTIISIYDVPQDQGGYVFVNWYPFDGDNIEENLVEKYSIWRYVENQRGWEKLGDSDPIYADDYTFTAQTILTSNDNVTYETTFKVIAHLIDQTLYESGEAQGYSLDNLSPPTPQQFSVSHDQQLININWEYDLLEDLSHHSLTTLYSSAIQTIDTFAVTSLDTRNEEYRVISEDFNGNFSNKSKSTLALNMHSGANLISFNVLPEDNTVGNVFDSVSDNVSGVITEGGAASQIAPGVWVGSLSVILPTKGYWVILNEDDMLLLIGDPTDRNSIYELHSGANLISFPYRYSSAVSNALKDDCEALITGIITEGGATSQIAPGQWVGSLSDFNATKGYWVIIQDACILNYENGCDELECSNR